MPSLPDSARNAADPSLAERVEGIAAWIGDLDARLRAAELATGDEKTAKELRRALEALSKHDPKLEKRLTDRVDVLADRMSTLASTVSTTASALAKKDGEIAALRRELEGDSKRIETLVREYGRTVGAEEVEKLRAAIRAVSHERQARTGDQHADELSGKVDVLAQRVDTLAKTVATTAAGLAGREGEIVGLRQRLDEGSSRIEATVAELHRVQGDEVLAEQLESLRRAVAATAAGLAGRESEIAGVRARIDEAYARVGSVVSDIQGSIAALSSQVVTLEELPGATEQALEERAAELSAGIDGLAERLDSLAASVESALGGLADRELEVTGLNRSVDEVSSRVDSVVAELRQALSELPPPGSVDPAVDARLEELSEAVVAVTGQLAELESLSDERTRDAASQAVELEGLLAEVGERLDAVERDRDAAAARLARADEVWTEEREWVRGRLEALAAAHADSSQTHESFGPRLEELGARLERLDGEHSAVAAEIARVSQTLDAEREALHAQLDGLAATMAEAGTSHGGDDSERLLAELAGRLDNVEQDGAAVACEIARTAAFWASELESIEARLDQAGSRSGHALATGDEGTERLLAELGGRLDAMERDRRAVADEVARASDAWTAERSSLEVRLDEVATHLAEVESEARTAVHPSSSEGEVAEVRVLVEGLRMRLASNEKELATLVSAREVGGRLDEVGRRLESLERAPVVIATAADGGPLPGDGRFRLELRALELRMEHAEAAARENREAVLVQLERLAARIEWRFQRLEAVHDAAYPEAVGGGAQVVPIRPLEA